MGVVWFQLEVIVFRVVSTGAESAAGAGTPPPRSRPGQAIPRVFQNPPYTRRINLANFLTNPIIPGNYLVSAPNETAREFPALSGRMP